MTGHFEVLQHGDDLQLEFRVVGAPPCPDDQLLLKNEIEEMEAALVTLYPEAAKRIGRFRELLGLAMVGLHGPAADPKVAAGALANMKRNILITEGGARKNRYFSVLGKQALRFGLPALILAGVLKYVALERVPDLDAVEIALLTSALLIWSGAMLGAWLSYGLRTEQLSFEELVAPEEDRLEPRTRLIFVGALAMVVALAFYTRIIEISFGTVTSYALVTRSALALLVGVIMGAGERALSGHVTQLIAKLAPAK